jgi:hypothetical protein
VVDRSIICTFRLWAKSLTTSLAGSLLESAPKHRTAEGAAHPPSFLLATTHLFAFGGHYLDYSSKSLEPGCKKLEAMPQSKALDDRATLPMAYCTRNLPASGRWDTNIIVLVGQPGESDERPSHSDSCLDLVRGRSRQTVTGVHGYSTAEKAVMLCK